MKIKPLEWTKDSGATWDEYRADVGSFGHYSCLRFLDYTRPKCRNRWKIKFLFGGGCFVIEGSPRSAKLAKQAAEAHWHAKLMEVLEP